MTTPTIATDLAAFAIFHAGVLLPNSTQPAIKTCPAQPQASINTADMPFIQPFVGPAVWTQLAVGGGKRYERTYRMEVHCLPTANGLTYAEAYAVAQPIMDALGQAYLAWNTSILGTAFEQIYLARGLTDTGIVELTWAGFKNFGFMFSVPVSQKFI